MYASGGVATVKYDVLVIPDVSVVISSTRNPP